MEITKKTVLAAMRQFDHEFRSDLEWTRWQENKAHKYAIDHEGQLYPVKKIVSLASGVSVSEFSGGRHPGHANAFLQEIGFAIVPLLVTNPDWTRDELILALNVYLKYRPNPPGKDSQEILELSKLLKRIGERIFPPEDRADTFRNTNGVYMKLMNFRRLDPLYTAESKTGLARGAKAEEDVWAEFAGNAPRCQQVAAAIIATLDDPETKASWLEPDMDEGIQEAPEGRLLTRKHFVRERNHKLIESKRNQAMNRHGKLLCEACGFDFAIAYGDRGNGFIECHHIQPVATLVAGHKTHVDDLALVCANCHRIIHWRKPWLSIADLKALINEARLKHHITPTS